MLLERIKHPGVKVIIITLLTTLTSVSISLLGNWDNKQENFVIKLAFFISVVTIYMLALVFYTKTEVNDRRIIDTLNKQVQTFEDLMTNIISICQRNANDVTTCIHQIKIQHSINLNLWSFDKACQWVCEHIYKSICTIGNSKNFGIAYVKLIEGQKPENTVIMNAYANKNLSKPTIYNQKRKFDSSGNAGNENIYHDLELFVKNCADIDIIVNKEDIDLIFGYKSKESRAKNKGKYNQYIGIPVFCDNSKMIGLLEVVCLQDAKLGLTKNEVEEIVNKFLIPYANILLLLHKMEKALLATVI